MSILANLKSDDSIQNERDTVGSGGVLDSGLYKVTIGLAYVTIAESGAQGLVVHGKSAANHEIRQTFWMTSGTAKGSHNYYLDKDGNKQYLAGFIQANALALLTLGKEISEVEIEKKVAKIYSKEAKAEVPTEVQMVVEMIGKEAIFGVIKQTVDVTKKNDATGQYEPTGESRSENEVDKIFRASDNMTVPEIRAQADTASFHQTWEEKWKGQTRDRRKKGSAATPVANKPMTTKPTTGLFQV